jgi:hypothetical protein
MNRETFAVSQKELQRVAVISASLKGEVACVRAAELLCFLLSSDAVFAVLRRRYTLPMKMTEMAFSTTDWSQISVTEHLGDCGKALWRTQNLGDIRVRMVGVHAWLTNRITGARRDMCCSASTENWKPVGRMEKIPR